MTSPPSVAQVRQALVQESSDTAAALLLALLAEEDARLTRNTLPPYADAVPPLLTATPPRTAAAVLRHLTGGQARRLLFGNFRQLRWQWLEELSQAMDAETLLRLLDSLATGVDAPRQAARLLRARALADSEALARDLPGLDAEAGARILGLVEMPVLVRLLGPLEDSSPEWSAAVAQSAMPPETARLTTARHPDAVADLEPTRLSVSAHVYEAEQAPTSQTVSRLRERSPAWQRAVLEGLSAPKAAAVLGLIAEDDPSWAAFLLSALGEWPLVSTPRGRTRRLFRARAVPVLAAMDHNTRTALLGGMDLRVARHIEGRLAGRQPAAYPPVRTAGRRRRRRVAEGVHVVELREVVETASGRVPLRVDLLELDPRAVTVRVCRASDPVPFARLVDEVGTVGRGGVRPDEHLFRRLGLVRLSEVVAERRAVGAINGNFYVDYGHYLDALDLGIDLAGEPHLLLGDAVGWFVAQGRELSAPVVNRGTLIITEDGRPWIRRVFLRAVVVGGRQYTWQRVDLPGPGTVLFTRLFGSRTPKTQGVVELTVSGGVAVAVGRGGDSRIPLLGFVLSVPEDHAQHLLSVAPDQPVGLPPDLPPEMGPVQEAMSCGPLLVRDGEVDVDLGLEGFGDKDTGVLPLSLTRAVDSFSAARSFVMTRAGKVVFGTVSGTQVGVGSPEVSAGMTFGELAQLCADLGAEDAMGLDGGGSSALVVGEGVGQVVNVPTGGSDVPPGKERFVATYLLALRVPT